MLLFILQIHIDTFVRLKQTLNLKSHLQLKWTIQNMKY